MIQEDIVLMAPISVKVVRMSQNISLSYQLRKRTILTRAVDIIVLAMP